MTKQVKHIIFSMALFAVTPTLVCASSMINANEAISVSRSVSLVIELCQKTVRSEACFSVGHGIIQSLLKNNSITTKNLAIALCQTQEVGYSRSTCIEKLQVNVELSHLKKVSEINRCERPFNAEAPWNQRQWANYSDCLEASLRSL